MYSLFSVPISITTKSQALALIGEWLREWRRTKDEGRRTKEIRERQLPPFSLQPSAFGLKIITTPNPEIIVAAQSDPALMKALQEADLSIPDGVGIVWALKLLGSRFSVLGSRLQVNRFSVSRSQTDKPKTDKHETENRKQKTDNWPPSRLSGLDLMESLLLQPQKVAPYELRPLKVMLLGGRPGVAQAAAATLQTVKWLNGQMAKRSNRQNPNSTVQPFNRSTVKIVALSGPQNISNISRSENNRLIAQINSFQPDLLFVAFGHGKQEKWLIDNRERLTAGVAMAVGGAFDQIADPSLRPPPYINSIGLGWLYRLLRQPWRIKRQLSLFKFVWMVMKDRILEDRNS